MRYRQTNRPTDRPTDTVEYRVLFTRLKTVFVVGNQCNCKGRGNELKKRFRWCNWEGESNELEEEFWREEVRRQNLSRFNGHSRQSFALTTKFGDQV